MNFTDLQIPFDEAENYFKPNNKEKLNRLFYKDRNYNKLLNDTTYFLIGEKGSGKTTYCAYFCNNNVNNTRSRRYPISVDDYNKIIQMKKDGKLNYTHYVTLWKAILLIKLLSTIEEQVKEGSQMALFPFISLSMRLPFSLSRTSPYATLHNLPAIWCKSGVVVGVVDFRPKCPVYRSDLQRNGLWLPWWLLRKSPS